MKHTLTSTTLFNCLLHLMFISSAVSGAHIPDRNRIYETAQSAIQKNTGWTTGSTAVNTVSSNTAVGTASNPSLTSDIPSDVVQTVIATRTHSISINPSITTSPDTSASTKPTSSIVSFSSATTSAKPTPTYTPDLTLEFPAVHGNSQIRSKSYIKLTKEIPKILTRANEITIHSWEIGAFTETLLEVYNPSLTPFEWCMPSEQKSSLGHYEIPWNVLKIAKDSLIAYNWTDSPSQKKSTSNDLSDYLYQSTTPVRHVEKALINGDGALGDPVSLIPAIWILAQFSQNQLVPSYLNTGVMLRQGEDYAWAIGNQIEYLYHNHTAPNNATISQREDNFELWSDMMYMISPSLTYLGLSLSNQDFIQKGLEQWQLESYALLDTTVNIYRHINGWDARLWATGNGWAVYGAIRNLYAVRASGFEESFSQLTSQTETTLSNVFEALFGQLNNQSLIPNYMRYHNATLEERDGDTAGTALIVAAYYRFITLCPKWANSNLLALAEKAFDGVVSKIDANGWVTHAVDPMGTDGWKVYAKNTSMHSPEAQAFTAKMWKARTVAGC